MRGVRKVTKHGYTTVWISADATWRWAMSADWPCSELSNRRLRAEFDKYGNLVDLQVNGRSGVTVPVQELNAILYDLIGTEHPTCDHQNVIPHWSRFAGTFSHHCQDCGEYIVGMEDESDDE